MFSLFLDCHLLKNPVREKPGTTHSYVAPWVLWFEVGLTSSMQLSESYIDFFNIQCTKFLAVLGSRNKGENIKKAFKASNSSQQEVNL